MVQEHILLVEDENIIARDIQQRLRKFGYAVPAIASSGQDAIRRVAEFHPDLVLMDIVLKGEMDGIDTAEHLWTHFQVPVVYLTAYADEETVQRAMATSPFGYVMKPIVDRQLQTVLAIALEKHRLESKIAESEKWLSTTLRCVGDAVITTNVHGQVTFMNPTAETLTGWPQAEACGKAVETVLPLVHEASGVSAVHPIRETLRTGNVMQLENHRFLLVARDGRTVPIDDSAAPIRDDHGTMMGGVLVLRDVTVRRHAEEALLTARKLEAIGTLAGGIAHTYNNLLTVILGRLTLATRLVQPDDPISGHLSEAEKATRRATEVTQQLLTFAQGGAPVKRLTALGSLLPEAVRVAMMGSVVEPVLHLAADLWLVEIDCEQIRQAMQHAVCHAVDATAAGRVVRVQADNVSVQSASHLPLVAGPYVRISISDEGEGLPAAQLDKIFDPYFTTSKAPGGGLGLATARAIVQKHDGHMLAVSAPGMGTTLHMYLPARPEVVRHEEVAPPVFQTGAGKILVMDDEEGVRDVLTQMLALLGYEVESAGNGTEAIALYRRAAEAGAPFVAVILDLIVMDGMGGRETIVQLRELDPQINAIVSSGYSNDAIMANFAHYGFRDVLSKPYQLADLSAVLQRVIHSPRY